MHPNKHELVEKIREIISYEDTQYPKKKTETKEKYIITEMSDECWAFFVEVNSLKLEFG